MPEPAVLPADTTWVLLPRDDEPVVDVDGVSHRPEDASPTARGFLHWAPLGHPGHTRRLAAIAASLAECRFGAFVVDVSVEVTLFVRLLGVPPIVVSQPGDRSDAPHRLAYDAAERILAPWSESMHPSPALERHRERVRWVGGISRWDAGAGAGAGSRAGSRAALDGGTVLVLGGGAAGDGSAPTLADRVDAAAGVTPHLSWSILGATASTWVADPSDALRRADVVVSAAGQNSIADLAAVGARAIVVPQERPFGEQAATAHALRTAGLAVTVDTWPQTADWPALIARARSLDPDWSLWGVDGAAQRAADVIAEVVAWRG